VRCIGCITLVALLAVAACGGSPAELRVATLSAGNVTAEGALLRAAFAVGPEGEDHIVNGAFTEPDEEGTPPAHWEGPVLLHAETEPELVDLTVRRAFDPPQGDAAAYLRYSSSVAEGWAGVAWEQVLVEPVRGPAPLILSYYVRHQYSTGTGHISDHGGFVELELAADDATYLLRFFHVRHGELPADEERIAYVDAGNPGWQTWSSFQHDVSEEVAEAFPHVDEYVVTRVRIGVLMHKKDEGMSGFYWMFDDLSLVRGETHAAVGFAYRVAGDASWTEMGWTTVTGSGVHEVNLTELATGTRYEYRAVLRTPDQTLVGDIRGFTPRSEIGRC